jgi:hypothetical protein
VATRQRAFGSIRPAGKTSWQASYKVDGQRFVAPSTFPSKADASAWLANVQADINRGVWTDPTAGRETLAQYVTGWLDRKQKVGHYRPRTLELVTGLLDRIILPALGQRELSDIKTPLAGPPRAWAPQPPRQRLGTSQRRPLSRPPAIFSRALAPPLRLLPWSPSRCRRADALIG